MFPPSVARYLWIFFFLLLSLSMVGCGAPSGDAGEGKRWFMMHNCSSCHGPHGNDGRAVDISGISLGFSSFLRKLRTTDSVRMPPFPEEKLARDDVADIYIYLKSQKQE